jgi:pyruvate dehydrogenase E1 component beta subunit
MNQLSYLEAYYRTVREEMLRDDAIYVIGLDVRRLDAATSRLHAEFGDRRVIDAPISEYSYTLAAMGSALVGMRPIVDFARAEYALPAFEAMINQIPLKRYMSGGQFRVPMTIRTMHGPQGGMGPHHSQSLESLYVHSAGMVVAVPATPYDLCGLLRTALRGSDPVIFCEHVAIRGSIEDDVGDWKPSRGYVPKGDYTIPFGQADIKRVGSDVTVVAITGMLQKVLAASVKLARYGISIEVVDPRTLLPLDKSTIAQSVSRTRRLLIAEESSKTGGIGAEISAAVIEEFNDPILVRRLAVADVPIPYSIVAESAVVPGVRDVVQVVREMMRVDV